MCARRRRSDADAASACTNEDGRTDGRTDGQTARTGRPTGRTDEARQFVRDKLAPGGLPDEVRRTWLAIQAEIELESSEPDYLVLDLALQNALRLTPDAPDLLAMRGASWVMRGRYEDGGNQLELAWRKNDGSADDPMMLAYLTIAARRLGELDAAAHFFEAFEQTNRSFALKQRVEAMT